jgi:hypothetical protein
VVEGSDEEAGLEETGAVAADVELVELWERRKSQLHLVRRASGRPAQMNTVKRSREGYRKEERKDEPWNRR